MTGELSTEHGELESADESTTLPAYLACSARPDGHPGVLVGFEMFGRTDYTATAPDCYRCAGRIDAWYRTTEPLCDEELGAVR